MSKYLITIYALLAILLATGKWVSGQTVASIVTPSFFNTINRAGPGCSGRGFYTRAAFLSAIRSFPSFGTEGTSLVRKREIAAFFANVIHETGSFCYKEEIAGPSFPPSHYCQRSVQYPCAPGKRYHGRGPIQLTWNYNYIRAGRALGFDGLNHPEVVSQNAVISFKTALWFWMKNCHGAMVNGRGFGSTIRFINGGECNGGSPRAVTSRVNHYVNYCRIFGVTTGPNLRC